MSMTAEVDVEQEQVRDLSLTAQERDELRLALGTYVREMHTEIAHTDRYEFRQELKARRALLQGVLHRLGGAPTEVAG